MFAVEIVNISSPNKSDVLVCSSREAVEWVYKNRNNGDWEILKLKMFQEKGKNGGAS